MQDVEIMLRVPEGEELADERMDALYDAGFDDATMLSREAGILIVCFTVEDGDEWEDEASDRAEDLLIAMPDTEVIDIGLAEE